ncbi:hypothetical protein FRC03_001640 [Tulasnella sp. 419]|nr:hypothetical protein FRC03_001640 [Tulasnella sp. 419]
MDESEAMDKEFKSDMLKIFEKYEKRVIKGNIPLERTLDSMCMWLEILDNDMHSDRRILRTIDLDITVQEKSKDEDNSLAPTTTSGRSVFKKHTRIQVTLKLSKPFNFLSISKFRPKIDRDKSIRNKDSKIERSLESNKLNHIQ